MTSWPASLPQQPQDSNYAETAPETAIRTQMDAGPAKVRRRLTAEVSKYKMSFQLTLSQVETLDLFFQNDIKGGALRFDMPHPRTGNIVKMRITGPPQYRALGGEMFEARVEMEEMP